MGNPIDDAAQDRINKLISEICTTFAVEFAKAYTQAVMLRPRQISNLKHVWRTI